MNLSFKKIALLLISIYFSINVFSQSNFSIYINNQFDPSKIKLFFTDGPVQKFITPEFNNNLFVVKEKFKSKYFRLIIMYPDSIGNLNGVGFLINNKKSLVKFNETNNLNPNKLTNYTFNNIIDIKNCNENKKLIKYTKSELDEFNKINVKYNLIKSDSNLHLFNQLSKKIALKELEFTKKNGSNYFYFLNFTQNIVNTLKEDYLLELYEVFNTSFPESFKDSYEGIITKELLEGNLNVKIGMKSPQFKSQDYLSNEISTENLKGKYYILSFWATWCSPCVKEIPQLKGIRDKYDKNQLEIISITRDNDSTKFINGIEKYKMNWTHVFNSPTMENLFGQKPIPSVYLIDKNGIILFSSWEKNWIELVKILKNELGK